MEAMKNLLERRSVRKYETKQVPDDLLDQVLEAGLYAPTGMNTQNIYMVAVRDKETRDQMMRMNAAVMGSDGDPFYGAPTVLVVLADRAVRTCVEDASLVIGNMMNAAFSVGVDSCWIHRAKEEFESEEGKALLKKLGIEGDYVGVGNLILGYRDGDLPPVRPRKEHYVYRV